MANTSSTRSDSKWLFVNPKSDVFTLLKNFFTEDLGSSMSGYINSNVGNNLTNDAYTSYMYSIRGLSGSFRLPLIFLDGSTTNYINTSPYYFLQNICRQRTDTSELSACNGLTQTELTELFDESCLVIAALN